jgi:AcrR family transcriptional regulator
VRNPFLHVPASREPQLRGRNESRAERTRQRILDAAGRCFATVGYAKSTVEEIAQSAGVSKGIVYHHFRGKEQLFELVLDRTLSDWAEVTRIDALRSSEHVVEDVTKLLRAMVAYARENPVLRSLLQLDPLVLVGVASSDAVRRSFERLRTSLTEAMRAGIERGELRPSLDLERSADVICLLSTALVDQILRPEWIGASDDRLLEASIDVLLRGIVRSEGKESGA